MHEELQLCGVLVRNRNGEKFLLGPVKEITEALKMPPGLLYGLVEQGIISGYGLADEDLEALASDVLVSMEDLDHLQRTYRNKMAQKLQKGGVS